MHVNLSYPVKPGIEGWQFDYYYNAKLPITGSRYSHYPPHDDEMCRALGHNLDEDQCDVVFASDGWSYISFPASGDCCKCENKFGSTRYDWLQSDAHFAGRRTVFGVDSYGWTKRGNSLNWYWASVDGSLPVSYNESWMGVPKTWHFDLSTYNTTAFDEAIVGPPPNCQTLCPASAVQCGHFRSG